MEPVCEPVTTMRAALMQRP
ncbi:unnamed protein product [Linum tenue]|uniref:Uncharacterized protein n=1 Tax=Linum tenue TaxID=586396 RepID=A0AAV0RZL9_9ROSI|nr:unnamed protein product [Linum tenue]CAI0625720.1 unnamed protein product [Linum tenue]